MFPVLSDVAGNPALTHGFFVLLGFVIGGWYFYQEVQRRGAWDERMVFIIVGITVGGALGERLGSTFQATLTGDVATVLDAWLYGGRSILGGLAGAYVGGVIGKRLSGYKARTGDYFAPAVALGLAIGRIGCFLTEAPGRPTNLPWAITVPPASAANLPGCPACLAGVAMHPSFLYEIAFLLLCFFLIRRYGSRISEPGEVFVLFLAAYAVFRFGVEFTRSNPPDIWGMTRSQVFLLSVWPILFLKVLRQARRGTYSRLLRA